MTEQYKVWVPVEQRKKGHIYDAKSGAYVGLASDEEKTKYGYNNPYKDNRSGCPYDLVIYG